MPDKVFVDSNLWIYRHSSETAKRQAVDELLNQHFEHVIISAQVLNECFNTLTRKHIASASDAQNIVDNIAENYTVVPLTKGITGRAMDIFMRYRFSFYDCLIIAAALSSDCRIVYSEDMQHGQIIENRLILINPFS